MKAELAIPDQPEQKWLKKLLKIHQLDENMLNSLSTTGVKQRGQTIAMV